MKLAMPVTVPRNRPGSSREVVCPVAPRASQTRAQDQSPMPPVKSSSALSGAQGVMTVAMATPKRMAGTRMRTFRREELRR